MNIKKLSLGAVLVTLLMTLLSLVSPTSSVKAETKKYVIATDITFAPFEYQDTNGEYVGIDIELMKSIAEAEGFEVEFKPLGFNAAVQALESGQVDAVMAGMGITMNVNKNSTSQIVTMTVELGWEFLKTLKSHLFLI